MSNQKPTPASRIGALAVGLTGPAAAIFIEFAGGAGSASARNAETVCALTKISGIVGIAHGAGKWGGVTGTSWAIDAVEVVAVDLLATLWISHTTFVCCAHAATKDRAAHAFAHVTCENIARLGSVIAAAFAANGGVRWTAERVVIALTGGAADIATGNIAARATRDTARALLLQAAGIAAAARSSRARLTAINTAKELG